MRYVGLDVHWRQSTICVHDTRGRKLSTQTIKGNWSKVLEELGFEVTINRRRGTPPKKREPHLRVVDSSKGEDD